MDIRLPWRAWLRGWRCLLLADAVPGYRRQPIPRRCGLMIIATWSLLAERRSRWLLWFAVGAVLLARTLAWRHDLSGWSRDLLLLLPLLIVAPWLASWRRRALIRLLRRRKRSSGR